jgi:hypothetical protein
MTIKQCPREKYNELTQKQEDDQNRIEKIDKDEVTYVGIERTLSMPKDQRKGKVDVGGSLTYKVLACNPINISGIPAWKIQYSALDGLLNGKDIYILKDNNGYVILYFGYRDL